MRTSITRALMILLVILLGLISFGCEKYPTVTVFILDSVSILTPEQRKEIVFEEFTHGRIIQEIIRKNSSPDHFFTFDLDKVIRVKNEETDKMENMVVIDDKKYLDALKRINKYADEHPDEKIVVNMSFGGSRHFYMELLSENDTIRKRAEEDFSLEIIGRSRNEIGDGLFNLLKTQYIQQEEVAGQFSIDDFKMQETIDRKIEELVGKGVEMVASAGNENTDMRTYPAAHPNVISVAAHDGNGKKTSYSNYGKYVDVCAEGDYKKELGASSISVKGTSFATPRVTALLVNMFKLAKDEEMDKVSIIKSYAMYLSEDTHSLGAGALNPVSTLQSIDRSYKEGDLVGGISWKQYAFGIIFGLSIFLVLIGILRLFFGASDGPLFPSPSEIADFFRVLLAPPETSPPSEPWLPRRERIALAKERAEELARSQQGYYGLIGIPDTPPPESRLPPSIHVEVPNPFSFPCPNGVPVPVAILMFAYENDVDYDDFVYYFIAERERLRLDLSLFRKNQVSIELILHEINTIDMYLKILTQMPGHDMEVINELQNGSMLVNEAKTYLIHL
ncbi:S8 family serine peptidase [Candidatus Peregrinibacteria bacterium]|nr:S8 family serine peptidase [Candidatus Peregrinibacteria bacterium]